MLTKRFNVWCNGQTPWLNLDAWALCKRDYSESDLLHLDCYMGLDLSSTSDLTSVCYTFPHENKVRLAFVSEGNEDKAKNILAALYAILTNRYNWQMFFEITGKGGSGKSIFANIATLLAGDRNTVSAKLEDFDNAKDLEGFENKTLILCPEQSKYGGDGGGLKAIMP